MSGFQPDKYDPYILSEEEKKRFVAALGDGFGYLDHSQHRADEAPIPSNIEAGLLRHRVYFDRNTEPDDWKNNQNGGFYRKVYELGALWAECPINFDLPLLRTYFLEQKMAYLRYERSIDDRSWMAILYPDERDVDRHIYHLALYKTYSKIWYEYHINTCILYIDNTSEPCLEPATFKTVTHFSVMPKMRLLGTLGRLIEQYYWKFLIEKSAIRGVKISEAAKSGGLRRASEQKDVHAIWQSAARLVWQEHPEKSKLAVASIVKRRLKLDRSVKHISRVLTRP